MIDEFFSDYKNSIVNSIRVAELGTIASVNGSTADINVQGYPLLIDVPLVDSSRDIEYKRGDRVLVVFTKGDINGAVAVGGGISIHDCWPGPGTRSIASASYIQKASSTINDSLPPASEKYRGEIIVITEKDKDIPYICLKNGSQYKWTRLLGGEI